MTECAVIVVAPSLHTASIVSRLPSTRRSLFEHSSLATPRPNSRMSACTDSSRHISVTRLASGCWLVLRESSHSPDLSTGMSAAKTPLPARLKQAIASVHAIRKPRAAIGKAGRSVRMAGIQSVGDGAEDEEVDEFV